MLIPKYALDQKLYAVKTTYDTKKQNVKCSLCESTGKIQIKGEFYTCPKCKGKTETIYKGLKYIICASGNVGKIEIEEFSKKYRCKGRITYMLDSTGVGSGTVWSENRLFPSEKEALDFCESHVPVDLYDSEKEDD